MEVCRNPEILKIILFIRQILNIVFIIVPIGLILMIGLDFFKNITASKEDEMKKNLSIAIKRIIYCVCIFFVPTIVNLVNNLVNEVLEDTKINYAACLKNADPEEIADLIINLADEAIEKAKEKQTMAYVIEAEAAVEKIEDKTIKNERQQEIAEIKEQVIANAEANREEDEHQSHITPGTNNGNSSNKEFLYELKTPDPNYSGHTVELTETQYLLICRALFGEREASSYEIYVALAQYIRDHVDAYELAGTKTKNYDNLGSRWLVSAGSNRANDKTVDWFKENRPEIIEAVDYVFKNGGSFAKGFMEFYVDKYDGSTPEIASNNLISIASQHCSPYGGSYNNHENFELFPEWGDTSHWFSCSICPWYSGVKGVSDQRK